MNTFCIIKLRATSQPLRRLIFVQEINAILGEKLSAEDEEDILAEFENLEAQVCFSSMYLIQF